METEYEFRERIYDATQAASELSKQDNLIRVVSANWNDHTIGPLQSFASLKSAYEFVEKADNADPHYIIGADIEEV